MHFGEITKLTIPILFDLPSNAPNKVLATKRIELILKQSKGIFTELSRHSSTFKKPKQIVYQLNPGIIAQELFEMVVGILPQIFRVIHQ
jgi:hypothetical protein